MCLSKQGHILLVLLDPGVDTSLELWVSYRRLVSPCFISRRSGIAYHFAEQSFPMISENPSVQQSARQKCLYPYQKHLLQTLLAEYNQYKESATG